MVFYCPKCEKCFVNHNDIIPKNSVAGEIDGIETGIYHVKCDCGNYLAGYMQIEPDSLLLIDYARNHIRRFNKGGIWYSRKYKELIKRLLNANS